MFHGCQSLTFATQSRESWGPLDHLFLCAARDDGLSYGATTCRECCKMLQVGMNVQCIDMCERMFIMNHK